MQMTLLSRSLRSRKFFRSSRFESVLAQPGGRQNLNGFGLLSGSVRLTFALPTVSFPFSRQNFPFFPAPVPAPGSQAAAVNISPRHTSLSHTITL